MPELPTTSPRFPSCPPEDKPVFHSRYSIRLQKVLNALQAKGVDFDCAEEYGEPGYSTDKELILFANWNHFDSREMKAIESVAEIEWSDEWTTVHNYPDKSRAFRTSPDSYGWESAIFLTEDGEYIPFDSLPDSGENLLSELREYGFTVEVWQDGTGTNHADLCHYPKAVPSRYSEKDLATIADLREDDCQTGFHPGQNDKPEDKLKSAGPGEYLLRIADKGQFDITWQVWKIRPELDENQEAA
jgi:hypothetical protein